MIRTMLEANVLKIKVISSIKQHIKCASRYTQGQSPSPKVREYFYFIDHQGQLFLDDAKMKNFTSCFKEKDFLVFFFKRLKLNATQRYTDEFPYLSVCGREHNFVRCDDRPIVFTHLLPAEDEAQHADYLSYNWANGQLTLLFEPHRLCMHPNSGRVYHPAPEETGGIGLIRSALAVELSKYFTFVGSSDCTLPCQFAWRGKKYILTNELLKLIKQDYV